MACACLLLVSGGCIRSYGDGGSVEENDANAEDATATDDASEHCRIEDELPDVGDRDPEDEEDCRFVEVDEEELAEPCREGDRVCVDEEVFECICEEWVETGESCCDLGVPIVDVLVLNSSGFFSASIEEGEPSFEDCTATGEGSYQFEFAAANVGDVDARLRCWVGRVWPVDPEGPFVPSEIDQLSSESREIDLDEDAASLYVIDHEVTFTGEICPMAIWVECRVDDPDVSPEPEPYQSECVHFWGENPDGEGYVPTESMDCGSNSNKVWIPGIEPSE